MIYRVLSVLFSLLFLFTVLVQFNDPDAVKWILIYGLGLIASISFVFEKMKISWAFLLACFYVVLSVLFWPDEFEGFMVAKGNIQNVERGREAVGLLIAALMMLILALLLYGKGKNGSKNPNQTPS